ncbi:MAG: protein kinase, partial [Gemmataceae bacterium]|nr:protein kinase [Gemmataceae bacterium]
MGGFEVVGELGRGAFGRVYLAREPGLAGRPVVLKVSSRLPGEGQTLARLQHTNIVPIYSAHRHGPYHVLCMPYLGATTAADLLAAFHQPGGRPESGKGVVSTLVDRAGRTVGDGAERPAPEKPPAVGVSRANLDRLERLSYPEAVLWLGVQLADGLAHAHDRGILHRDLKPANVLLADDGRPMLLDFNLAADAGAGELPVGGTLRYMPPEALADLAADRGHADPRADLYALGLILYELLTDRFPYPDPEAGPSREVVETMRAARLAPPPDASTLRPDVTPATAAILAASLDPDPARRYPSAAALRDDLQRQLDHRPLAFAREPSARERVRKWAKRHPRLASGSTVSAVAAGLLLLVGGVALAVWQHNNRLVAREAVAAVRSAGGHIQALTFDPQPPAALCREAVEQSEAVLAPYRAADDADWVNGPLLARLPEADRPTARRDVAVVLRDYAFALDGLARHDPDRRAELHDQAQRARGRAAAADPGPDDAGRLRDALRDGRYREAIALLRPLAEGDDPSYSVFLRLGYCHLRLAEPAEAVRWLDVAAALSRDATPALLYRGAALLDAGRAKEAVADFDRVLARHPDDPEGLLNRALARVGANDPKGAIADLDRLEQLGGPFTRLYFVREHARRLAGDPDGAEKDFRAGLAREPADARSWVARGE